MYGMRGMTALFPNGGALCMLLFLLPLSMPASGQEGCVIHGRVIDSMGRPISYATVSTSFLPQARYVNAQGAFSLPASCTDTVMLRVAAFGYEPFDTLLRVPRDTLLLSPITLHLSPISLDGVSVAASRSRMVTVERIDIRRVLDNSLSGGGIEALIKTLPGVHASNELSVQYSVRGGSFDENLVYIDGVEVYRPSLLRSGNQEGMSIVNPDMVSRIEFSAGAFPAKYGDRMSSVLNIDYRQPSRLAARLDASLLESRLYLEGVTPKGRLAGMLGLRYKTTRLLLNASDVKGDYRPAFSDLQTKLTYAPHPAISLSLLGGFARNAYNFRPIRKTTQMLAGSNSFLSMNVYYEGQERDLYSTGFVSLSTQWKPIPPLDVKLTLGIYTTSERETFDILAEYWLDDLKDGASPIVTSDSVPNVGIGGTLDHARNHFNATVLSTNFSLSHSWGAHLIEAGVQASSSQLAHNLAEWRVLDSAGYTLPHRMLEFLPAHARFNQQALHHYRFAAYLQSIFSFQLPGVRLTLVAGGRLSARERLDALRFSPRASLAIYPLSKPSLSCYLAGGYYFQYPFYREMRDPLGQLHPDLLPQKSIHAVLGTQWSFLLASHPFRLQAELYYKHQSQLVPYTISNVNLQYEGVNAAQGRVAGFDLKLHGELVSGAESWISISFMRAEMKLNRPLRGVPLSPEQQSYFPSPADQRFAGSLFLQDYFPGLPSFRVHLAAHYAMGFPFTPPHASYGTIARFPAYRRIDIGFSKVFKDRNYTATWLRHLGYLHELTLSAEVLNLLNFHNTISYMWVTVPTRGGGVGRLAVPNYLTARCVNFRVILGF